MFSRDLIDRSGYDRAGFAAGYDRFVIQFSGPVPAFTVTRQNSPAFTGDASGQPFNLQGSGGVRVVVQGASSMSPTWAQGITKPVTPW